MSFFSGDITVAATTRSLDVFCFFFVGTFKFDPKELPCAVLSATASLLYFYNVMVLAVSAAFFIIMAVYLSLCVCCLFNGNCFFTWKASVNKSSLEVL